MPHTSVPGVEDRHRENEKHAVKAVEERLRARIPM
jgi:hypothetical protein